MAHAICSHPFPASSDLDVWPYDLEIALPIATDVGNLSYKFERSTFFRFWGIGTDRRWTAGVTRNAEKVA